MSHWSHQQGHPAKITPMHYRSGHIQAFIMRKGKTCLNNWEFNVSNYFCVWFVCGCVCVWTGWLKKLWTDLKIFCVSGLWDRDKLINVWVWSRSSGSFKNCGQFVIICSELMALQTKQTWITFWEWSGSQIHIVIGMTILWVILTLPMFYLV